MHRAILTTRLQDHETTGLEDYETRGLRDLGLPDCSPTFLWLLLFFPTTLSLLYFLAETHLRPRSVSSVRETAFRFEALTFR